MRASNGSVCRFLPAVLAFWLLSSCGGGGGGGGGDEGTPAAPITSFELLDPTPGAGNQFGAIIVVLANNNIVVASPFDSSVAPGNGAVHLYDPMAQKRIASIYGDDANDNLGSRAVVKLTNGNFVIASPNDDVAGVVDAGSVRLVNGATGLQIGAAIVGDVTGDQLGSGGITALPNGNFVIVSPSDDEGGIVDAGSVRLVDGATGVQIGSAIVGDTAGDQLGAHVTTLTNSNFVIVSPKDDVGGIVDAGSVRLVDGTTGAQIGAAVTGDVTNDLDNAGAVPLPNGNFVIDAPTDDVGGIVDAGSVRLISGTTGAQIGPVIAGDAANDRLGAFGVTALSNGNFVVVSPFDDVGGIVDAGSARLVNGTTGAQIGGAIAGDGTNDRLGSGGVVALTNGNFAIGSPNDDVGGIVDAGSVRLVDGATGVQIGSAITGDGANDFLGGALVALSNGNFVIQSILDDVSGIVDAGSVRLVNGATGAQIGPAIAGNTAGDAVGISFPLPNGNFVIFSPMEDVGGNVDTGSMRLVNGVTGAPIGVPVTGDVVNLFGVISISPLANSDFVITLPLDDPGGVAVAGSARRMSGTTGAQIGSIVAGIVPGDLDLAFAAGSATGSFYVLTQSQADKNGLVDSGMVRLIAP